MPEADALRYDVGVPEEASVFANNEAAPHAIHSRVPLMTDDEDTQSNTATSIISAVRSRVQSPASFRSQYKDSDNPRVSRFATELENELARHGATLLASCDPKRPLAERRHVPSHDSPYSLWSCPDNSIAAVFESRGESANSPDDVMRYASMAGRPPHDFVEGQIDTETDFAGAWDGERANELASTMRSAIARLTGDHEINMDHLRFLAVLDVPHTDRISPDNPAHELGIVHGVDAQGSVVLSADECGPLFAMPTDPARLDILRDQAMRAAQQATETPLGRAMHESHERLADFYSKASSVMAQHQMAQAQEPAAHAPDDDDTQDEQKGPTESSSQGPKLSM